MSNTLQKGSTGLQVGEVQKALGIEVDDDFGPETEAAVIAFQKSHNLVADGIVGSQTISVLLSGAPAVPHPASGPVDNSDTPWMAWMRKNIGQPEVTGKPATAFDRDVFSHTSYGPLEDNIMDEGCAATACAALEETGYKSPHSAAALSFHNYGTACDLKPGCIVVFQWASGGHHVSFCDSIVDNNYVACLGGNQSSSVKVSTFSRSSIIATRWPVK